MILAMQASSSSDSTKFKTKITDVANAPGEKIFPGELAKALKILASGGDVLIVAGYLDQGGKGIIQASIDAGAFDIFVLPDGMIGDSLPAAIGKDLNGSYGTLPGTDSPGADKFNGLATAAGFKP